MTRRTEPFTAQRGRSRLIPAYLTLLALVFAAGLTLHLL